jgi:REP element-mobilizing transposase RayT
MQPGLRSLVAARRRLPLANPSGSTGSKFRGCFSVLLGHEPTTTLHPEGGALVEVTCRTLQNRFLLRPGGTLDEILVGVLGRAQRRYEVRCCGYMFASNHLHLLLDVDNALQLSRFMGYINSKIAREISRLHGWTDKIWSRRYQAIVVSGEDGAQIARLKYLLANGVKEGLVARPQDWPGVHAARALVQGKDLTGYWFDRTQEYAARNRGEIFDRLQYASVETLHLSPLPCWKHLPEGVWRALALDLIHEIENEAAVRRSETGSQPLGAAASWAGIPTIVQGTRRGHPLRSFTPSAPQRAASSGRPTAGSSPPSGRRRPSSERETATLSFRSAASLRPYRSSVAELISGFTDPQMSA